MKRLFLYIILLAAQLTCLAQTNPKIDSLYAYLKAKGVATDYFIYKDGSGLRKEISLTFDLNDESLPPVVVDARTDSAFTVFYANHKDAYKQIRRTLRELQDYAQESYSYEYHKDGADTVAITMALRSKAKDDVRIFSNRKYKEIWHAPEFVQLFYNNFPANRRKNRLSPVGMVSFRYDGIIDTSAVAKKDFNTKQFLKVITPLLRKGCTSKRTILCKHDSTFNYKEFRDSVKYGLGFAMYEENYSADVKHSGESSFTIYKFKDEAKGKSTLNQIMECAQKYITDNPNESYWMRFDNSLFSSSPVDMFNGYLCSDDNNDVPLRKRSELVICAAKTGNGFYIITDVCWGEDCFPQEWNKLKRFVNYEKVYYDEEL